MGDSTIVVPLLDLKAQYRTIREEIRQKIDQVCDNQAFILGPEVEALEQEVGDYCGAKFGVGVSSGTDALIVALMALGIGEGDEVITTPYSFFATASSIARVGAKPVFVDIDPVSYNINPALIESAITPRTKAIMPVHLYGQCTDMGAIKKIAAKHNLRVIEDACQAIGAEYQGQRAGSFGDMGCFSFFPSKNLGGFGDGGLVTTDTAERSTMLKNLRMHGEVQRYHHKFLGGNFRIDALQAAVLRVKLRYLDSWTEKRRHNASIYSQLFTESDLAVCYESFANEKAGNCIVLPAQAVEGRHIYNQFVLRVKNRDQLMKTLQENKVGCQIYYPVCLHQQECFEYLGYKSGSFRHAEQAAKETLAIPIYPELTEEQLNKVAKTIISFYGKN